MERNKKTYEDHVLLKLRRKYSKDETVAALNKKVSDLEIEKGMLIDEIEELKEKVENQKKTLINYTKKGIEKKYKYKSLFEARRELCDKQATQILKLQKEIESLNQK